MSESLITLVVALSLLSTGITIWTVLSACRWVRRSPTREQTRHRKRIVLVGILILFLPGIWHAFRSTRRYRTWTGYRSVRFINKSGGDVRDFQLITREALGPSNTNIVEVISANGSYEHSASGNGSADIAVEKIICLRGTNRLEETNVGVAHIGETLSIRLEPSAHFVVSRE